MRGFVHRLGVGVIVPALFCSSTAIAGGFQISEQSMTGLGRAFAGSGISGEDNSDMFYNPASLGLTDEKQASIGWYYLTGAGKFENSGSSQSFVSADGIVTIPSSGADAKGAEDITVPNIYYSRPINDKISFGIGLTSPFAVRTDYGNDWVGRYHSAKTELFTIDLNPNVSYKINDSLYTGFGLSLLYGSAELTRSFFTGLNSVDIRSKIDGDDVGVGFNFGMIMDLDKFRLGIGYRSKVDLELDGDFSSSTGMLDSDSQIDITIPETVYLSGLVNVNDRLEILSSYRWTNWEQYDELKIKFDNGLPDSVTQTFWEDSGTFSIGTNWRYKDDVTLRLGYAYDETPVPDQANPNASLFPGSVRNWFTLGLSYQYSQRIRIDAGYAYIDVEDIDINSTTNLLPTPGIATDNLVGDIVDGDVQIFGLQLNLRL